MKYKRHVIYLYFLFFLIGNLFALFNVQHNDIDINKININEKYELFRIVFKNISVITIIYIIAMFNSYFSSFIIAKNGFILGYTITRIIRNNAILLALIIPHGIFEIPCFLLCSYVIVNGKSLFRNNPNSLIKYWIMHSFFVFFIAVIEVYITPFIFNQFIK